MKSLNPREPFRKRTLSNAGAAVPELQVHQYVVDLSTVDGIVTVVLNGGYIDSTGSAESEYQFSNIYMY